MSRGSAIGFAIRSAVGGVTAGALAGACASVPVIGRSPVVALPPAVFTTVDTAARFAPGVVTTGRESHATATPDGRVVYFVSHARDADGAATALIMQTEWNGAEWTRPRAAPFNIGRRQTDPQVALNGRALYFSAPRRRDAASDAVDGDWDIWAVRLGGDVEPTRLTSLINSDEHERSPSVTIDSIVYFAFGVRDPERRPVSEIRYHYKKLRTDAARIDLPPAYINPSAPFITASGRVLVFAASGRESRGGTDLFVSIRREDGRFLAPQNLGREVNGATNETAPSITADGQYLFFTRENAAGGSEIFVIPVRSVPVLRDAVGRQ